MSFGLEGFSAVRPVREVLLTSGVRVTGTITTRFSRVAEILNQLSATHLPVDDATVETHASGAGDAETSHRAGAVAVAVEEILVMLADELADAPSGDMRVPKQPARVRMEIPPFRLDGTAYVPVGGRPIDGLLNLADRFIPTTDVRITSPLLAEAVTGPVAAVRRDRAHVVAFPDEESTAPAAGDDAAG